MTETAWLIGEYGSPWESWAQSWCAPGRQLILTLQGRTEVRAAFEARVLRELTAGRAWHASLRQVLVTCVATQVTAVTSARVRMLAGLQRGLAADPSAVELRLLTACEEGKSHALA